MTVDAPPYSAGEAPPYDNTAPTYHASLEFFGLALFRVEFDTPWSYRAGLLQPVVVELNSSQLRIHALAADKCVAATVKALFRHQNHDYDESADAHAPDYFLDGDAYGECGDDSAGVLLRFRRRMGDRQVQRRLAGKLPPEYLHNGLLFEPTAARTRYAAFAARYRGKLLHSFTLQNLAVGEAPSARLRNYKEDKQRSRYADLHYRNALRLRVEHVQALLHFWSFHGMVHWFRNLRIGSDLALALELRKLAVLKSIPRNFSASNNALLQAAAEEALLALEEKHPCPDSDTALSQCPSLCSLSSFSSCASDSSAEPCGSCTAEIFGNRLVCLEDAYSPMEKQYISNCIPVLNSYDKWAGSMITLSDSLYYTSHCHPGNVIIPLDAFNAMVKNKRKHAQLDFHECREFYIDDVGLVSTNAAPEPA